ncbi:hypothetical protein N9205_01780, partial [Akkermansiaceae bacterium]|nr:hypothetical protein [Akkermansiaceae bacterium]
MTGAHLPKEQVHRQTCQGDGKKKINYPAESLVTGPHLGNLQKPNPKTPEEEGLSDHNKPKRQRPPI